MNEIASVLLDVFLSVCWQLALIIYAANFDVHIFGPGNYGQNELKIVIERPDINLENSKSCVKIIEADSEWKCTENENME